MGIVVKGWFRVGLWCVWGGFRVGLGLVIYGWFRRIRGVGLVWGGV